MNTETKQFESDYLPLQPAMQRMAESLLGDEQEAADVVQDCFVTLWSDRRKLLKVENREAWCIMLVKRRCIDMLRRRRPTVDIDTVMNLADEPPTDDGRLQLALRLIDRLPERQAQAVRLRHFDDADTQTIAHTMNIKEGNVYTILSRAYSSLKQMILDYEEE
ncbi:MAG: RNA polymerase sigma factor [Bacteroidales bacterium]|nr:RNA polymerase sigma factor [Bacteroidales bacterium]